MPIYKKGDIVSWESHSGISWVITASDLLAGIVFSRLFGVWKGVCVRTKAESQRAGILLTKSSICVKFQNRNTLPIDPRLAQLIVYFCDATTHWKMWWRNLVHLSDLRNRTAEADNHSPEFINENWCSSGLSPPILSVQFCRLNNTRDILILMWEWCHEAFLRQEIVRTQESCWLFPIN